VSDTVVFLLLEPAAVQGDTARMTPPEGWSAVHLDELESFALGGVLCRPIRRSLDVRAFGVNAYSAERAGGQIIEEHTESGSGQQELYLVFRGRATFVVDGQRCDAPAGTMVFVQDPNLKRAAVAETAETLVLAIGGSPDRPFDISPWESCPEAVPLLNAGRLDEAIAVIELALAARPADPLLTYGLACVESRAGKTAEALAHVRSAIRTDPTYARRARTDPHLESLRDKLDLGTPPRDP
jgi:tetratricopeptide (TPR) repeat protein